MTDRFEIEVDTTMANEKWHVEVKENLQRQAADAEAEGDKKAAEHPTEVS
jgi:3-ketosteroid 9alpha-monooxygenase subunit A